MKPVAVFSLFFIFIVFYLYSRVFFPGLSFWQAQMFFMLLPGIVMAFYINGAGLISGGNLTFKNFSGFIILSILVVVLLNASSYLLSQVFHLTSEAMRISPDIKAPFLPWKQPFLLWSICLLPALAEEFFFRGFFQKALSKTLDYRVSIAITSFLFAFIHFSKWEFPLLFLISLFFGWTLEKYKSLLFPIIAHFITNVIGLILLGYNL